MDENRASHVNPIINLNGELAPGVNATSSTGEPLFVINLCAAMTPIDLNSQPIAGLDQYKLYQVSRMEDGRRRYRLRLGFFSNESQAEDVLSSVRGRYATAFTSCLCEEDLKHATGYLKCSVQDLERTGRYAVLKVRGDSGATTTLRALDIKLDATLTERLSVEPSKQPTNTVARSGPNETSGTVSPTNKAAVPKPAASPAPQAASQPTKVSAIRTQASPVSGAASVPAGKNALSAPARPVQSTSPSLPPKAMMTQPLAAQKSAPRTLGDVISARIESAPKRNGNSLMRQAHAMAPMDAVERAKAVPATSASGTLIDAVTTGKFQAQPKASEAAPSALTPKANPPQIVATKPAATNPLATQPVAVPVVKQVAPKVALEAHIPPAHTPSAPIQKSNQAFHVGAGIVIPETSLSLAPTTLSMSSSTKTTPVKPVTTSPIMSPAIDKLGDTTGASDLLRARALAKQSIQWRQDNGAVPSLDTTQTIRTLTKTELEDANRQKWFVVQLALSDHPANLDTMPRLDIFEAYSLYSVAVMEGSGIRHALRLGFFREEVSAQAVMGYLKTFFNDPTITRIPDAEHDRFIDAPKITAIAKPASSVVVLDETSKTKPSMESVPVINSAVARSSLASATSKGLAQAPMARSTSPAVKRAATAPAQKKPPAAKGTRSLQEDLLDEAQLLGLTDTQILRVRKNPSLLSRLLGK
jgi:hypothetical protein